jgi:hypothetical protein
LKKLKTRKKKLKKKIRKRGKKKKKRRNSRNPQPMKEEIFSKVPNQRLKKRIKNKKSFNIKKSPEMEIFYI